MELSDYLATLRRYWVAIVVIILVGAGAGFAVVRTSTPLYKSTSSVFVSATSGENASDLVQGSAYTQNLIQSFAALAQMPSVLDPVIQELGLDVTAQTLAKSISADAPLNTIIIEITVVNASPEMSAKVANAVAESLSTVAQSLSPKKLDSTPAITMKAVATASVPTAAFSPNTRLIVIIWAAGAAILAIAFFLGRRVLNRKIQSERELAGIDSLPLLAALPHTKGFRTSHSAAFMASTGLNADTFRRMADHVVNSKPDGTVRSAVVTSLHMAEGKTTVALGLALALSEQGIRVLLLDADLRRSEVTDGCGLLGHPGLTDVVAGTCTLEDAVVPWTTIDVLPAGTPTSEPGRLMNAKVMEELFGHGLSEYDFVLCDSAAMLPVADTLPLTRLTDGAILVVPVNTVSADDVSAAVTSVSAVNGNTLGFVLNGSKVAAVKGSGYDKVRSTRHTRALRKGPGVAPAQAPKEDVLS